MWCAIAIVLGTSACGGMTDGEIAAAEAAAAASAAAASMPAPVADASAAEVGETQLARTGATSQTQKPQAGSTTTTSTTTGTGTATAASAATGGTVLTPAGMRADMTGQHESFIVGLPPEWSWGSQADPGFGLTGFPAGWTNPAYTFWGIVGPSVSGSPARNARVQIRNLRADFKRNGAWYRAQTAQSNVSGANYTDYSTNASTPADVRSLGADGVAVKVIQSGGHYHFYPNSRVPYGRDMQAVVVAMDVRLVKDDPNGADDLDSARIYGVAAGDVYQSMTATWNGQTWVNGHAPIGRFRRIGREWRTITAHLGLSSDTQFNEYISWAARQQ